MPQRSERNHDWFAAKVCGNRFPREPRGRNTSLLPPCSSHTLGVGEGRGRVCAGGGLPESRVRGVGVGLGRVEVGGPVPQRGVSLGTEGLNPQSFNLSPATSGFAGGSNGKESACQYRRQGDWGVRSLGREDSLEEEMATHSSILAWRIPWTEEPGGLESMGSQRVRHD